MNDIDDQTWLIDAGDIVITKRAESGPETLTPLENLIYCLWVADYGMCNAGDLEAAKDVFPDFHVNGQKLARELELPATLSLFSLQQAAFEREYDDRFAEVCSELRTHQLGQYID